MSVVRCEGCVGTISENPRYPDSEAVEAFTQINALGRELYNQQRIVAKGQSLPSGLPTERVHLGKIITGDGLQVEVVYGSFRYSQRSLCEERQPRVFGSTDGWVLAVREGSSERFRPIAYEEDFAELPAGLKRPLVDRIRNVQETRQRASGLVA